MQVGLVDLTTVLKHTRSIVDKVVTMENLSPDRTSLKGYHAVSQAVDLAILGCITVACQSVADPEGFARVQHDLCCAAFKGFNKAMTYGLTLGAVLTASWKTKHPEAETFCVFKWLCPTCALWCL